MVNYSIFSIFNPLSLLGILDLLLGIGIPMFAFAILVLRGQSIGTLGKILYAGQMAIALFTLPIVGLILIFNSWRYDPLMQFGSSLLHLLVIYLVVKDIAIAFQSVKN